MTDPSALLQPHVRHELRAYISELCDDDPRIRWQAERENGLASGINEVFHFFFDDHDFEESAIGVILFDAMELSSIRALMDALTAVLDAVGDAGDDEFVLHPLWHNVREAARAAQLSGVQ